MPKQNTYTRTEDEVADLRQAMKGQDAKLVQRATLIYNLHQGHTPAVVAQLHAISEVTVYNWFNRYQADGITGLLTKPKPGRPPKADDAYCQRLAEVLDTPPPDLGFGFSVWTLPRLQAFLEHDTGVKLSHNRLSEVLRAAGYVYRRPKTDLGACQDPDLRQQVQAALDTVKKTPVMGLSACSIWTKVASG